MNTPTLRFKEFSQPLQNCTFKKVIASNKYGPRFNAEDYDSDGNVKTIRGTDISLSGEIKYSQVPTAKLDDDFISDHLLEDGDLVMITTADCGLTGVFRKQDIEYIPSAYAIKIRLNNSGCPYYFKYYLQTKKLKDEINKYIRKGTVSNLPLSDISKLAINLPTLPEQTKIANFLTAIDDKIAQLSQTAQLLTDYKKGVMQQIFSQQLRFKDDDGREFAEWEEKTLGEITEKISDNRNKKLADAKVYSVTNSNGFVLQSEHFDKVVAGNDLSNYKIIQRNEFAYNPARINVGSIAYFENDIGIISSLYVCFKTKDNLLDKFLISILELEYTKFQIENLGEGGVRIYLWYDLFALIKCKLPCIEEQTKIANFLTAIDDKINHNQTQLDAMKQYKAGLLQQMFV